MKVMLHHIQVRMADKALTRCQINTQCLYLAYTEICGYKNDPQGDLAITLGVY